ncbi:hypothetical protein [Desulfurivibrio alkaliphilus]|nr:hypothetical protein [Desulfurivibrio alkaliphilus]
MDFLEKNTLPNGLRLTFYDKSRRLAGDRWLVELQCAAECPLTAELAAQFTEPDDRLRAEIMSRLGDKLEFSVNRTRHFIDEQEKEQVLAELLAGIREHVLIYFVKPDFPRRLLLDTCAKLREDCLLDRHRDQEQQQQPEDDGPADFSALFRDQPGR